MIQTVLVVAGGRRPSPDVVRAVKSEWAERPCACCIAVDGGADHAVARGWPGDIVVGDMDSVSPETQSRLRAEGVGFDQYPKVKDFTDLELALQVASAAGSQRLTKIDGPPGRIVVVGIGGGRFDHLLANVAVVAAAARSGIHIEVLVETARMTPVVDTYQLVGRPGSLVTLLPAFGDVAGVTTSGLVYPLSESVLPAGAARGVSNVLEARVATVTVSSGVLLVIEPDALVESASVGDPDPNAASTIDVEAQDSPSLAVPEQSTR